MKRVYSGKSDKKEYKNMTVYEDGSKIYFNDLQPNQELDRIFTECWNSLSVEKKLEINQKIKEKRKQRDTYETSKEADTPSTFIDQKVAPKSRELAGSVL